MSIEIREIKVIGAIKNNESQNDELDYRKIQKMMNDYSDKIVDKCVTKVLKKIEKNKRR